MKGKFYPELILILIFAFPVMPLFAASTDVRLNSLGFLPNNDKIATINGTCTAFTIIRVSDGSVRYSGTVTGPLTDAQTGETTLYKADFSTFTETGTFYMNVSNGAANFGTSINFAIDPNTYNAPFVPVFLGMYEWRCGTSVSVTYAGTTWSHAACHLTDASDSYIGGIGTVTNATKGWHDAGDYNKYVVNAGITLGQLFMAWEMFSNKINSLSYGLPSTAPAYPEYLEELKWETDWLLTMQLANGNVLDKVSELVFSDPPVMPETDGQRFYWGISGTVETATFCANMAMASRNFQPYDAAYATTCLNAATAAYNYLTSHTTNTTANITGSPQGNYTTSDANAGRFWAAVEMWETTGAGTYLTDAETRISAYGPNYVTANFDWTNDKNLGMYTYALSTRTGRNATTLTNVKNNITTVANSIVTTRNNHAYGRPLGATYEWGCNGEVARQAMMLQVANQISPNAAYLNTALDAIGYLFGRNMHDRSYVTGVGINPPMNPHHRPSRADGIVPPWPGYLVGGSSGANNNGKDPIETLTPAGLPIAQYWTDQAGAYSSNEVAINWQGALIYAMAGFIGVGGTPTFTPTWTLTATPTWSGTPTLTVTPTYSVTFTPTFTRTVTATFTGSPSPTTSMTFTRTITATFTGTVTANNTGTFTMTSTPSFTATFTYTGTPTFTISGTQTFTRTGTPTYTSSIVQSASATVTADRTSTVSPSSTFTATSTGTVNVPTFTFTATKTSTPTYSSTATPSFTLTSTLTASPTGSRTATPTYSRTITPTSSMSPTSSASPTGTPPTPTSTSSVSDTPTVTKTDSVSPTYTGTPSGTATYTYTATDSPTKTTTPTGTPTITLTLTLPSTATPSASATATSTGSAQPTNTSSVSPQNTFTETPTTSFTPTLTLTLTNPSITATPGTSEIKDIVVYPNPYDPDAGGDLNLRFTITSEAVTIKLKIYTAGFRAVKEKEWDGDFPPGEVNRNVAVREFNSLANGTYYYLIIADLKQGGTVKSKPDMLIILR